MYFKEDDTNSQLSQLFLSQEVIFQTLSYISELVSQCQEIDFGLTFDKAKDLKPIFEQNNFLLRKIKNCNN